MMKRLSCASLAALLYGCGGADPASPDPPVVMALSSPSSSGAATVPLGGMWAAPASGTAGLSASYLLTSSFVLVTETGETFEATGADAPDSTVSFGGVAATSSGFSGQVSTVTAPDAQACPTPFCAPTETDAVAGDVGAGLTLNGAPMAASALYEQASSLNAVAGTWSSAYGQITIDGAGIVTGLESGGRFGPQGNCVISGQVSLIDPKFNAYDITLSFGSCIESAPEGGAGGNGIFTLLRAQGANGAIPALYGAALIEFPSSTAQIFLISYIKD